MNERNMIGCYAAAGLALAGALGLAVWLIGGETLRTLALILVAAVALALLIVASALPIRAYRRRDVTGETHYYHDGTTHKEVRILDGRAQPVLLPGPGQSQAAGGLFPELLRGAWTAGMISSPARPPDPASPDADPDSGEGEDPDGWGGPIRP